VLVHDIARQHARFVFGALVLPVVLFVGVTWLILRP
jgi:hypothetical protein